MEFPKQIEVEGRTPEELERILDTQIALYRARRSVETSKRGVFLMGAILILIAGTGAALLILSQMVSGHPHHIKSVPPKMEEARRN